MKRFLLCCAALLLAMPQLSAATTKVYATFANVTCYDNAQWDASTQTLTWTMQYGNQMRQLGLPQGDLSAYEKLVIETADLQASNFRVLVYVGDTPVTYTIDHAGTAEMILAEQLSSADLKNIGEIAISGSSSDATGSVRVLNLYLETFDDAVPQKKDPELAFSPSLLTVEAGETFTTPTLSNPHDLPVSYSATSSPDGFATVDASTGALSLGEGKGRATITATFAGNDEYKDGQASYTIIVRQHTEGERPLVYEVENTGADFPEPAYPTRSQLPFIEPLTDPFMFSDWSGRALDFSDWERRRSEIGNELQHYELGRKPTVAPEQIQASMNGNTLTVKVTVDGRSITLTSTISYPSSGTAPYPVVIGMGGNGGSLPAAVFNVGPIAHMAFNFRQVATDSQNGGDGTGPFDTLYPELKKNGTEIKWAWGVSRLIDGLQQLGPSVTRIDTEHIAVTGCSYAGKMALFCGAFDERIALTIPQEPGGGGIASWRVSNWLPIDVERISNTNYTWFLSDLRNNFNNDNVGYLPYDHHELAAMICPRALIMIGNPSMTWLADPSGFISIQAARKVWQQYGIEDRCGYSFLGHGDHCGLPQAQYAEVQAFIRRYLLGQEVDTDVQIAPQNYRDSYDAKRWMAWWGTDAQPPIYLSTGDEGEVSLYLEAENMITADNGGNFRVSQDASCSGGKYVETAVNNTSLSQNKANWLIGKFTVEEEGDYFVYARLNCNGSYDDDSYYVAYDSNTPARSNGLAAGGNAWTWMNLGNYVDDGTLSVHLTPGDHQLVIVGREDGAKIDCVKLSTSRVTPDPGVLVPNAIYGIIDDKPLNRRPYDLQGRPVAPATRGLQILDGRKTIVK